MGHRAPPNGELSCQTCLYSVMALVTDDGPAQGEPVWRCFRYPPTLLYDPEEGEVLSLRPDADEWCGEWTPSTDDPQTPVDEA